MIDSLRPYKGLAVKKIVLVMIVLSALGSLVACSGEIPVTALEGLVTEEPYRLTLSPKPDWLVRWLNEPVCQPPCWEKITPGKTSFTDALAIADTISGAKVSNVGDDNIRLGSSQHDTYDFALLLSEDANIQEVTLFTRNISLELSEIVDRYGFPDEMLEHIFPGTEFTSRSIHLLYYDLGMVISSDLLPGDPWNKVSLSPETSIASISFFAPQLKYYFNIPPTYGSNVTPAIKLNGYGNYDLPEGTLYP